VTALLDKMSEADRAELAQRLKVWRDDPCRFVLDVFGALPDRWQEQALQAIAVDQRVAMSACKGPGKSCVLAWTIWWFLATRVDAQIICTSVTGKNLQDGLWKELAVWQSKSGLLQDLFEITSERIISREQPKTWWASARSWAQDADATQQANTLAGFHAAHVMIVLDEIGSYPLGVLAAAEGIFANKDVEAKIVGAGNPTRPDGPLYLIAGKNRGVLPEARRKGEKQKPGKWDVIFITGDPDDPARSPRIDAAWAQQLIDDFGRDHDWVRVNVLGQFPRVGEDKLLGPDDIVTAEARSCLETDFNSEPIIFGLDVARMGQDRSVLYKRQGCVAWRPWVWRKLDSTQLGDAVAQVLRNEKDYDYLVVDLGGPGAGVFDRLKLLGFEECIIPIDFGGSPLDARNADRGTEAWMSLKDWVLQRGCLPSGDGELGAELTTRSYDFKVRGKRTCFVLEPKPSLRARGLPSPDKADALALTFAAPLGPRPRRKVGAVAALFQVHEGRYRTEDDAMVEEP
jgi:hypothetical protein